MNNEVRKPREFWVGSKIFNTPEEQFYFLEALPQDPADFKTGRGEPWIRCKEILPGDDSIRVSREDWGIIREILQQMNQGDSITGDIIKNVERIEREQETK